MRTLHNIFLSIFQQLTDKFRLDYSQFWSSILKADEDGMQKNADRLGVGELYGLFACMVTGRSWNSIRKGIDKSEKNAAEVIFLLYNLPNLHLFSDCFFFIFFLAE